jgi:excisionase family DNA binding protein
MTAVATRSRRKLKADDGGLLKPEQVMKRLNIKKTHLYQIMTRGELPYVEMSARCRRFDPADVEKYIADRRRNRG